MATTTPPPPVEVPSEKAAGGFGLTSAIALIMGSIIGVGIFNLPTSLSSYGPISLASMALTTVGALALALLFASLSRRLPADGGPYAYSRVAFGNGWGFANAWSYWITAWAGNAAIAVGWVLYVEEFINEGHNRLGSVVLVLIGLWVPAAINLSGVKNIPRATILGTLATAVVYMLSLTAVFGILPSETLTQSTAPFSDAVNSMFGGTGWGDVMSIVVIVSGLGALNGWTMICAEMPLAAAKDGLFPARFKELSAKGVPRFGIIASTTLALIAMAIN